MKLGFEARALAHENITGVERYSIEILKQLEENNSIKLKKFQPTSNNRYIQHIWEYTSLPKLVKESDIDVLFCPSGAAPFNLNKRIKLAVTIHDIAFLNYPDLYSRQFAFYYGVVLPKIIKRADIIFSVSDSEQKRIENYYPASKGKIFTVHEAASNIFFNKNLKRKKYILAVASLNKNKNLVSLIKAFQLLIDLIPHKLILIGGNRRIMSTDNEIFKLIKKLPEDRIVLTGYINDEELVNYYNQAELFVFPSYYEGFGIPPLEAMACGCPVIVSNTSSLPEVCKDGAIYIDPNDVNDIRTKILNVLTNPELSLKLIENGFKRTNELSWKNTTDRIINILGEII